MLILDDITITLNIVEQDNIRCIIYIAGLCEMTKFSRDFGTDMFREKVTLVTSFRNKANS